MVGRGKPRLMKGLDTATPSGTIEMGDAEMEEDEYGSCIGQTLYGANPGTA
jgi:hypothetical protein